MNEQAEQEFRAALLHMLATMTDEQLGDYAWEVSPEALGMHVVRLKEIEKRARKLWTALEVRYGQERRHFLHADPNGKRYVFRADRERHVSDPVGLRHALRRYLSERPDAFPAASVERAFEEEPARVVVKDHGLLTALAQRSPALDDIVRDFRTWKYGLAHLVELDDAVKERNDE